MSDLNTQEAAVSVTVLTGFLGSGKTTLLNRILQAEHGLLVGVIVNEFGELSIDQKFIANQNGDVIELANGCVCCTNQGDLLRAVAQVMQADYPPDYILIETSGLADPLPVAQTLLDPGLRGLLRLDGIVTLVDAENFDRNLDAAEIAYNQIVYGDILLLNKCDLVGADVPSLIEGGIRQLNPDARIVRCTNADVDLDLLLDVGAFRLEEKFGRLGRPHVHESDFTAVVFRTLIPFDPESFQAFMKRLPVTIFRGKGIFHVAGMAERLIFHQVGDRCAVQPGAPWGEEEERMTELVFIGRGVDRETLLSDLKACLKEEKAQTSG